MSFISHRLSTAKPLVLAVYSGLAAFGLYSCMYAFRKPFTVGTFQDIAFAGLGYKSWLIIFQLIGYTLSKFYGIKFISGLNPAKRWQSTVVLILFSWMCLGAFALLPPVAGIACLFLNGVALGMIWGLVFGYLEGRSITELAGAMLSASFIFSSGNVKSTGKWVLMHFQVSEFSMPFLTGLFYVVPMLVFLYLLEQIPPPTPTDLQLRSERTPMTATDRKAFLIRFFPGIVLLITSYVILTILRDVRDNFAAEMWSENGFGQNAAIFTQSEIPSTILVLGLMGLLILVKDNYKALAINHFAIAGGLLVCALFTLLFSFQLLSFPVWMIAMGVGLYAAYIPFNCILFERLMATFKIKGNSGFAIYLADSFGYLGSVGILLVKETGNFEVNWTHFLSNTALFLSIPAAVFTFLALIYFSSQNKKIITT